MPPPRAPGKLRPREISLPVSCPLPTEVSRNMASSAVRWCPVELREMPGLELLRGYLPRTPQPASALIKLLMGSQS